MIVPNYIRPKMHLCASHVHQVTKYDFEIANWLENTGVDIEPISDGDGTSFEKLLYGNDVTDELYRRIEELFYAEVQIGIHHTKTQRKKQSKKNLLRSVQVIKYTCGAGTPEEAETNCTYFIRGECTASFCEYRRKKQTNADRIRAMNDEELAEFLIDLTDDGNLKIREWLQQPAEEDDHA